VRIRILITTTCTCTIRVRTGRCLIGRCIHIHRAAVHSSNRLALCQFLFTINTTVNLLSCMNASVIQNNTAIAFRLASQICSAYPFGQPCMLAVVQRVVHVNPKRAPQRHDRVHQIAALTLGHARRPERI